MSSLRRKCYCNVSELPIFNWWRIQETRQLIHLFKKHYKLTKLRAAGLQDIWAEITDDFVDKFGFNNNSYEIILAEKSLMIHRLKFVLGDKSELTFIDIETIKLKSLREKFKSEENNFYETKARIESIVKHAINPRETSVREYYSTVEMIQKDSKKNGR